MVNKRVLGIATTTLAFLGVVLASIPFLASFRPSAKAGMDLPRLNIKELAPGSIAWFDIARHTPHNQRYLVARFPNGAISLFAFPMKDGLVGMPDLDWWHIYRWCERFELQDPVQPITPTSIIHCKSEEVGEWGKTEFRWTLDGKNLGQFTADLYRVPFVIELNEIVAGKRPRK